MPTLELTFQYRTDSGSSVIASIARSGERLPLRCEGCFSSTPLH